jgi:hypothetical protein
MVLRPKHPNSRIDALLPHRWAMATAAGCTPRPSRRKV